MANVVVTDADATVKWFDPQKGYGFFSVEGYEKDIFVHVTMLGTFNPWELTEGAPAVISFASNVRGELQVTKIQEICLFYLKREGEIFSLPKPFDYPDVAIPTVKDHLTLGETRTGVLEDILNGFGFLKVEGVAKKIFVHFKDQMPKGLKPEMGQVFDFKVGQNDRGLLALNLTLVQSEVETETAPAPATETSATASNAPAEVKKAKGPRITRNPQKPAPEGDVAEAASAPAMAAE